MRGFPALALLLLLPTVPTASAVQAFGVRLARDGLVVEVPYTMGTHRERVTGVDGALRLDPDALRLEGGRLVVPLADFQSDDPKRGCHLREALGLDYARSRFPREHVCDAQNRLAPSGPDALAFPEVILELSGGAPTGPVSGDGVTQVELNGTLTLHGRTRALRLRLGVERVASPVSGLRVRGRVPVRLSDYGVVVKSARVLFVSIAVKDEVEVVVDALLEPLLSR